MRIAIIGAGISGLSLYLFLEKLGVTKHHNVKIYESRKSDGPPGRTSENGEVYEASSIGGSLGLSPNGLKVLQRWDEEIYTNAMKAGHAIDTWRLSNARGWVLADVPSSPNEGERMLQVGRYDLWQCIKREVVDEVIVQKKIVGIDIREGPGANALRFEDRTTTEAELVVGADGIWSIVRRAIFNAGGTKDKYDYSPQYEGLVGVGSIVPVSYIDKPKDGLMNVVFGSNGFFGYGIVHGKSSDLASRATWWSTFSLKECPDDWRNIDREDAKRQLHERHRQWKDQTIRNIVDKVSIDAVWPTFTTPLLPTWGRDGCVLVGDAAHALQPSSGQGASMALEDSEALALFLHHYLDEDNDKGHVTAAEQYHELRQSRVAMVHKKSQEVGAMKQDMGLPQEMIMYFFIWLVNRFKIGHSYNRSLYEYDGPVEVKQKIEKSQKSVP